MADELEAEAMVEVPQSQMQTLPDVPLPAVNKTSMQQ
jgi:hypothetical protein